MRKVSKKYMNKHGCQYCLYGKKTGISLEGKGNFTVSCRLDECICEDDFADYQSYEDYFKNIEEALYDGKSKPR